MKRQVGDVTANLAEKWKTAKRGRGDRNKTKSASHDDQKDINCNRCGYKHAETKCLAFGQTCKLFHKRNRFAKICKSQGQTRKIHAVEQCGSSSDMLIGTVEVEHEKCVKNIEKAEMVDEDDWTQDLIINRRNVTF